MKSGADPDGSLALFREIFGRRPAKSGQTVNVTTALEVSTVLACLRVIGEGIAQSPLKLYRARADGKGSDPASDLKLYNVLYRQPNEWQTAFAFFETLVFHAGLCGNFFAFINRVRGEIVELIPIEPHRVSVKQNADFSLTYTVRGIDNQTRDFDEETIWHVRGPSWNSWMGMEPLKLAREAIGLTMAIEADQAHLYKNGLRTSGTYSVEGKLTETQYKDLRKYIKDYQADEGGGPLILDNAAKYLNETMTGVDAQTLESRRMQVEEICRAFRVMPIMVGHSDKAATYASAEQMFLAHVIHTLAPWCARIEQSIDNELVGVDESGDDRIYARFNLDALTRGSMQAEADYFSKALGAGGSPAWMTQNQVRAIKEWNPLPGGDELPKPTNVAPSANPKDPTADPNNPKSFERIG
jgi:HK97 family phage portal protein